MLIFFLHEQFEINDLKRVNRNIKEIDDKKLSPKLSLK